MWSQNINLIESEGSPMSLSGVTFGSGGTNIYSVMNGGSGLVIIYE